MTEVAAEGRAGIVSGDHSANVLPRQGDECASPHSSADSHRTPEACKDPGSNSVLLANPRLKKRFLRFLELSGVGRVVADGTDEDGARAARMDDWIV